VHLNQQVPLKPMPDKRGRMLVHSTFHTIQGEGPFAGRRSVFVRLHGCNLQCPLCDTEYTNLSTLYTPKDLLAKCRELGPGGSELVVITGGEPFRHNLGPFVDLLAKEGMQVQIETNGTLPPTISEKNLSAVVVCSPKTPTVNRLTHNRATHWKYVLEHGHVDPRDSLPTRVLGLDLKPQRPPMLLPRDRIFVQPLDEQDDAKNRLHLITTANTALKHGYRLGVQMHKLAGLP